MYPTLTEEDQTFVINKIMEFYGCLLYTSDAADERSSVDLGGRRIIKKKKTEKSRESQCTQNRHRYMTREKQ